MAAGKEEIKREILARMKEADLVAEPEALELILSAENPEETADALIASAKKFTISTEEVRNFLDSRAMENQVVKVEVLQATGYSPSAKDMESNLQLSIRNSDITNNSKCTGTVDDFVKHFKNRYQRQKRTLSGIRGDVEGQYSINDVKKFLKNKTGRIIAMITSKRITKNGHMLLEVEDEEATASCLIPKDSNIMQEGMQILEDEVLALDVYSSTSSLLIVKNFTRPGKILQERRKRLIEKKAGIAFLSDLHVGSKYFLQKEFTNFLEFLQGKGDEKQKASAEKIKYISIAGDLTDGIGIYPGQEKQLITKDIYVQYEILSDFLQKIPEYIEVIVSPGNHDAVRGAEPQPALPQEFTEKLKGLNNIHFVGNPSSHLVEGLDLLIYHGTSADTLISHVPSLKDGYNRPELVAVGMLERRHLCPMYGEDAILPEEHDYLMIDEIPDMFHFGHVHRNGQIEDYNGTLIVNSGTWQGITDFQVRMGHVPTPCLLPVYDMNTGKLDTLNFGSGK